MEIKCDWEWSETRWLFKQLSRYIALIETASSDYSKRELTELRETLDPTDEVTSSIIAQNEQVLDEEFPLNMRYSFVALIYSLLEARTKTFAQKVSTRDNISMFSKKNKKSHLVSFREYVDQIDGIQLNINGYWEALLNAEILRNCIIHHMGVIDECRRKDKIQSAIKSDSELYMTDDGKIGLRAEYCLKFVAQADHLFDTLNCALNFGPRDLEISE